MEEKGDDDKEKGGNTGKDDEEELVVEDEEGSVDVTDEDETKEEVDGIEEAMVSFGKRRIRINREAKAIKSYFPSEST